MIIHGRNLIIKVGGVAIAAAKSCDINVKAKEIEVSSPTDGEWEHSIMGRKSWQVTTNQLVTSLVRPLSIVGTTVSLSMEVEGEYGSHFDEFVNNVNVEDEGASYDKIVWDKTRKKFLFKFTSHYSGQTTYYLDFSPYDMSKYTSPSDGDTFNLNGQVYTYYNGDLHAEKLTGQANVVEWRGTGAVGNLAQGSFRFNGNGELAPASLPST